MSLLHVNPLLPSSLGLPPLKLGSAVSRRAALQIGSLGSLGLSLPQLLGRRACGSETGRAKNCIVVFLMGGVAQHSTWDPKPFAPAEVRGEIPPIATNVPGMELGAILPKLALQADKLCLLRAVTTGDNAHSSSGYYMLTGVPHAPQNVENANPGAPNDWPTLAALVRKLRGDQRGLPGAVRLPMHIFNTDNSVWPGQDAGFLGLTADPWLLRCNPAQPNFHIPEMVMQGDDPLQRLLARRELLVQLDKSLEQRATARRVQRYEGDQARAFDLLTSASARSVFQLDAEPAALRDGYGRQPFGQSLLLARRLVEAGVSLVQVNWFRAPEEPSDAPVWDSHVDETRRLQTVLGPVADAGISSLLTDLSERGLFDETLVVCLTEFGRSPRFNGRAGRDHWGSCFSVMLAGGGIQGGCVYGASDAQAAYPQEGRVEPQDITATILSQLGIEPHAEYHTPEGRPVPASRGQVITGILQQQA